MKYPCGIIKDLLPLHIDEVCTPESKEAIEAHLSECTSCKQLYETMKAPNTFNTQLSSVADKDAMADSLKQVKDTIHKKIRNIVLCAVAAVALCLGGYWMLFQAPIKEVSLEDVAISASVYDLEELMEQSTEAISDAETVITSNENDHSPLYKVTVPGLGSLTVSEETIKRCKYVSAISIDSEYLLRKVKTETKENTMYISAFKTTLLNNDTDSFNHKSMSLEFQEIRKIVYVDNTSTETVLWSKP